MKEIKLTQGRSTLVDDELFDILNKWKWQLSNGGYAVRGTRIADSYKGVFIHQIVAFVKFGYIPDGYNPEHKNGNRLDNTFNNIRLATARQNSYNRKSIEGSTSKYVGVHWHKQHKKWVAQIHVDDRHIYLGDFDDEREAAMVRDRAAIKYFGEFARLNFKENN